MRSHRLRAEVDLARRAINERWPLTAEKRRKLVDRLVVVALTAEDNRAVVAAARAAIAADALNLAEQKQREGQKVQVSVNVAGKVAHTVEELRKLPPDELVRQYRQALGPSGAN